MAAILAALCLNHKHFGGGLPDLLLMRAVRTDTNAAVVATTGEGRNGNSAKGKAAAGAAPPAFEVESEVSTVRFSGVEVRSRGQVHRLMVMLPCFVRLKLPLRSMSAKIFPALSLSRPCRQNRRGSPRLINMSPRIIVHRGGREKAMWSAHAEIPCLYSPDPTIAEIDPGRPLRFLATAVQSSRINSFPSLLSGVRHVTSLARPPVSLKDRSAFTTPRACRFCLYAIYQPAQRVNMTSD